MELTAINRNAEALTTTPVAPVHPQTAETREVIQAVKAVNATEMFGQDNQLLFARDRETQKMVIRLVNQKTGEVVSQIPAEYVLRVSEDLKAAQQQGNPSR